MSGRDADAERVLRASVDRAQKAGDAQTAAQSLNNLGNLYAMQGRFADAGGTYRQAIDAAARAGNKSIGIRASANLARALFDEGRYREMMPLLSVVGDELRAQPPSHEKAYGLIGLARLNAKLMPTGIEPASVMALRAYAALNDALAVAESIQDARALVCARLPWRALRAGRTLRDGNAIHAAGRVRRAAGRRAGDSVPVAMADRADPEGAGDSARAIQAYQHAVTTLGTVRRDFIASGSRTSFRESVGPVYFQLADLLLERSGTLTDPKQVTQHLVDARSAVEVLKGAELQDYFQDDCVTALRADDRDRPPRLEHRRALSDHPGEPPGALAQHARRHAPLHEPGRLRGAHARDPVVPPAPGEKDDAPVPAACAKALRLAHPSGRRGARESGHRHAGHRAGRGAAHRSAARCTTASSFSSSATPWPRRPASR